MMGTILSDSFLKAKRRLTDRDFAGKLAGLMDQNDALPLPIARPPWTALGKEMESCVRKAIYDFSLLDQDVTKIAIALSGGKDSLGLLFLLHSLRGRGFPLFKIQAIHVDGEFSCGAGVNADFLQSICRELDVEFTICSSTQKREGLECYNCSRERRRLIFNAAKDGGSTIVAFGHHRDDSAQTLLLNLLHKAEFAANLPKVHMRDYGVTIIRPLIYLSEDSLINFAKQYGFARITCQCPVGQDSKRKTVAQLIHHMENFFPNARGNLAKAGLLYGSNKAANP
jgi:tRNA(Ile)-lysidine synthase TilS/MesJ